MSLTEQEADERAKARNLELARLAGHDRFAVPVQNEDGTWSVEERTEEPGGRVSRIISRIFDALP